MAAAPFTLAERAKIRMYLGWSDQFRDMDTRLESQMDTVGNRPEADMGAASNVRDILAKLANVDSALEGGLGNQTLKAVEGGTIFQGEEEMKAYRKHGRNLIQRMAIIFDVTPQRDYYGEEAASGGMLELG